MDPDPDALAGVVDLFGALTRPELVDAFEDLAARSGDDFDPTHVETAIDGALDGYYLVPVERGDRELLAVGPAALPRLPAGGEDLPHLLSVEPRSIDTAALAEATVARFRADAARAVQAEDERRIDHLLDVCYDLEAWAPVETGKLRDRLDAVR